LDDAVRWTKDQFVPRISKPRDPRPGWNLVSVPAIYLGVMSQNLPVLSRDEINQVAVHLARHQEADGAWLLPPPANGAPPIWESRETLALWACLAWEPHVPADSQQASAARASRQKVEDWLGQVQPTDTVQAATLRLLLDVRLKNGEPLPSRIQDLVARQKADGGWSQTAELASDALATGQALYALSFAGVQHDRPEIQRAVSFLITNQRDDGSWPMTSRNHPGVETTRNPIRNPVPITYFGSAWATLGLVRSVPTPADSPANQQHAIDEIKRFHGKYDVEDKVPGRAVVGVDLRYYDLSDDEVENFAKVLGAFPQLHTLQIKSAKVTDAGLAHLPRLTQVRKLSLAAAAITDTGLSHLQALNQLQELSLQGTKVTDAGVREFQTARPNVKVDR
jgi:hypothetical protein